MGVTFDEVPWVTRPGVGRGRRSALRVSAVALAVLITGGCGAGSVDGRADRAASTSVTTSAAGRTGHAAVAGEPALFEVPGYAYRDQEAGSAVPGMTKALVESINKEAPGFVTGHSDHSVLKDGQHVLNLTLLQIDMAAVGDLNKPQFVEGLLQYAVGSAFPNFSERTIAGQWVGAAHVNVEGENRVALIWPEDDNKFFALVTGRSQPEAEAFLAGLINAHRR